MLPCFHPPSPRPPHPCITKAMSVNFLSTNEKGKSPPQDMSYFPPWYNHDGSSKNALEAWKTFVVLHSVHWWYKIQLVSSAALVSKWDVQSAGCTFELNWFLFFFFLFFLQKSLTSVEGVSKTGSKFVNLLELGQVGYFATKAVKGIFINVLINILLLQSVDNKVDKVCQRWLGSSWGQKLKQVQLWELEKWLFCNKKWGNVFFIEFDQIWFWRLDAMLCPWRPHWSPRFPQIPHSSQHSAANAQ